MKIIFGLYLALSFGALFSYAATTDVSQTIQSVLVSHPEVAAKLVQFFEQSGIDLTQLNASNVQSIITPEFIQKFKDFLMNNKDVLDVLLSTGLFKPTRIDWNQVVQVAIQLLPIAINLLGKRDLSVQQLVSLIPADLINKIKDFISEHISQIVTAIQNFNGVGKREDIIIPDYFILDLVLALNLLQTSNSVVAQKVKQFLAENGISIPQMINDLTTNNYQQYLTIENLNTVSAFFAENQDVSDYFYENFGDLIGFITSLVGK